MVRKDFVNPDPYPTHSFINEEVIPSHSSHLGLGDFFLNASVWVRLHPSLHYTILPHLWPHHIVSHSPAIQCSGAKSGQVTGVYIHFS